jgi:hypothetical protein
MCTIFASLNYLENNKFYFAGKILGIIKDDDEEEENY